MSTRLVIGIIFLIGEVSYGVIMLRKKAGSSRKKSPNNDISLKASTVIGLLIDLVAILLTIVGLVVPGIIEMQNSVSAVENSTVVQNMQQGDNNTINSTINNFYAFSESQEFEAQAKEEHPFYVRTRERLRGDSFWHDAPEPDEEEGKPGTEVEAHIGDTVEFVIEYANASQSLQEDVMCKAIIPSGMSFNEGSTFLYNSNSGPDGYKLSGDISTTGINIGNYNPNGNAFVRFDASVTGVDLTQDGNSFLVLWGQVGVGETTLQDEACTAVAMKRSATS